MRNVELVAKAEALIERLGNQLSSAPRTRSQKRWLVDCSFEVLKGGKAPAADTPHGTLHRAAWQAADQTLTWVDRYNTRPDGLTDGEVDPLRPIRDALAGALSVYLAGTSP